MTENTVTTPHSPATAASAEPRLHIRDLQVRYAPEEPFVLDGVDLDLYPGEVVALLGASGSGKSTLTKAITGFAPVTAGTLRVGSTDLTTASAREIRALRSQVGQIFQQFNLVGRVSVLQNVLTGSLYRAGWRNLLGTYRHEDRVRALELLDRVGIAHKAGAPARSLSGGQQQRVAIARALMQNPRAILADEPVASLDPLMSHTVLTLLQEIAAEENIRFS